MDLFLLFLVYDLMTKVELVIKDALILDLQECCVENYYENLLILDDLLIVLTLYPKGV